MSRVIPNNIALKSDQTESNALRFESGEYLIAASIGSGGTMPEAITLQLRFGDESGNALEWQDTDVVLNATDGWQDTFSASPFVEYKVVASAAGATVHTSLITQAVFN